jgi:prophage tail gpP-like protein
MSTPDDTVKLAVNNQEMTGWTAVKVTRALDLMPSAFDISLTERNPSTSSVIAVEAGMACQVLIGSDPVITGWIDRVALSYSPSSHVVRIMGRSKSEDMVDCSITPDAITGMQIFTSSFLDLATRLGKPYKISVAAAAGTNVALSTGIGDPMKINAILTETSWEVLERVARYLGLLIYDLPDGSLLIANVGASSMKTGFEQGINVQSAAVSYSMDERFSIYLPCLMTTNFLGQQGVGGMQFSPALDEGVRRLRQRIVVSEQFQYGKPQAEKRAQWERARRFGRSQAVHLVCDNWRDQDKKLWTPNAFASLNLPTLKLTPEEPWIIGEVSFVKDAERGTVADIVMMPREAFQAEPEILVPFLYDPSVDAKPGGMTGHA